jgi:LmbE family N-acetylglucosaminyl deacetylase
MKPQLKKRRVMKIRIAVAALCAAAMALAMVSSAVKAQVASAPALPETVQAINKARISTRIMFITAHPDDETASLLAYLSRGLYADVALLTLTRGQGGQNAVGPEQGGPLGVVRTTELLAADKQYGVHQFFTRAVDPGFSKSPEHTMKLWGTQIPMEDMVRAIRTYRPEVVINGWGGVHSGHGQHQASGLLTPQAIMAAADPTQFPDQIKEGLAPWKVTLELRLAQNTAPGVPQAKAEPNAVMLPVSDVSELWGESYSQMGADGHALHLSQGTPALFGNGFFRRPVYLVDERAAEGAAPFDPKIFAEPIASLAVRFPDLQGQMEPVLASADTEIAAASKAALMLDRVAAAQSLAEAGKQIGGLQDAIAKSSDEDAAAALWEIAQVRKRIDLALADDIALPFEGQADRHELVAGEHFTVEPLFAGKPAVPVKYTVDASSIVTPAGWTVTPVVPEKKTPNQQPKFDIAIPAGAKAPSSPGDVILPFPAPLVKLALRATIDDYQVTLEQPVESQIAATTGVEVYPLDLVPAVTVTVDPTQIMVPQKKASAPVTLFARVRYHGRQPVHVGMGIDLPEGWSTPAISALDFKEAGDQLLRYVLTPPAHVTAGAYPLHPFAKIGDEEFRASLEPIPTLPTRNWSDPDDATVHVLNLAVPTGLQVGYVAADNDPIPDTLRQIGIQVDLLDEKTLAFGDLSHYDAVIVGIRAYELRPDLMSMNWRVLDYVKNGGTLLVQYQRDFAWNKLLPAPFPAKMLDNAARVTDASSPVRFILPDNPLLNTPNKITMDDFQGWTQERALYLWDKFDPPFQAVLGLNDFNEAEVNGALVYAKDGKGVYVYTGLSFFRQLPAGVPGAYRLFVNLISQTRHAK